MPGVDPVSIGIDAALQIPKLVVGISQFSKANKALKAIGNEQYPEFTNSPEMLNAYNRAEAMSKYGFSPEEQAKFDQDLARNNSSQYRTAVDMGGGQLGNSINGVLNANNADAINQFASAGAGLKRQNIQYADSLAQRLQSQKNLQTQNRIARRQMLEQSYGAAKSAALGNITGAVTGGIATTAQGLMGRVASPDASLGDNIPAVSQDTMDVLKFQPEIVPDNDTANLYR